MKTAELIRQLQEADPSGELECSVGNCDIYFVDRLPGYYDGCQQVLVRDESKKPYWHIVGGRINNTKDKVVLKTMGLSNLVCDHPETQVDCSELGVKRAAEYQSHLERSRQLGREISRQIEWEAFRDWAKEKSAGFPSEMGDDTWKPAAERFFNANLWPERPMPDDLKRLSGTSWHDRRRMVWDRDIEVSWDGLEAEFQLRANSPCQIATPNTTPEPPTRDHE